MGNLDAERDWGYAKEFVEAMWLMLQQPAPEDFVLATGRTHSVREFMEHVFSYLGLDWQRYYSIDPRFNRPADPTGLLGDSSKAKQKLGWKRRPRFTNWRELWWTMICRCCSQPNPQNCSTESG